ncbi:MAG: PAC2 family protein [Dehalococcoidia bacterium]|nr:PAC2 family protein [Dehalococcoidia bacterium]
MDDLQNEPLRDPILIVGLGSAGQQSPFAAASLLLASARGGAGGTDPVEPEVLAEFDPDEYYDFTVARPLVRLVNEERSIEWPHAIIHRLPTEERDVLFFTGVEPHYRWQRFSESVAEFAEEFGVDDVILLSAFGAGTPHTRPVPLRWLPLSEEDSQEDSQPLTSRFGLAAERPQYQGPATFGMVLGVLLRDAGLNVGALSAVAPFYLGVDPNPNTVRALASALAAEFSLPLDTEAVDARIEEVARQAAEQMDASGDLAAFVRNLEQQYDDSRLPLLAAPEAAPSVPLEVDEVLADVDALLRDHRGGAGADRPRHA